VIAELDAVQAIVKFFTAVPLDAWRSYMRYHYLVRHASVLPKAIDAENFDFYGHTLNGTEQQRERWKRAVSALQSSVERWLGKCTSRSTFRRNRSS